MSRFTFEQLEGRQLFAGAEIGEKLDEATHLDVEVASSGKQATGPVFLNQHGQAAFHTQFTAIALIFAFAIPGDYCAKLGIIAGVNGVIATGGYVSSTFFSQQENPPVGRVEKTS